jgi:hypothetical protein
MEAGSDLLLTVSGKPGGGAGFITSSGSGSSLLIGLLAFGSALIIGGVWLYRRSRFVRGSKGAGEQNGGGAEELGIWGEDEDANTLMDAILALDDRYQAGELPEVAYKERRAELKARLRRMLGS